MKKDFQTTDLFRIVGLGRSKKPGDDKYGRFNRRMMAATIDSLFLVFALPLLDPLFRHFYGAMPVDFLVLQQQMRDIGDPHKAAELYWTTLQQSGFFRYWVSNTMFQFSFLAACSFLCWLRWSATPGKMIMRLKIVDARTEQKPSFLQFALRAMAYFVSGMFFGLGFIWICFNKRRQSWHDKLADTVVVTVPWKPFKYAPKGQDEDSTPVSGAADQ